MTAPAASISAPVPCVSVLTVRFLGAWAPFFQDTVGCVPASPPMVGSDSESESIVRVEQSTGAVAAAGALLGPKAMYVAATIKMIQNVLIGVTAFGIAVYWCTSVEKTAGRETSLMEIWHRFPKFVIGFLTASSIFSIYSADLGPDLGTALINKGVIDGIEKGVRTWFFVLAFTAIGLSTNFRELAPYFKGGKPLILYVCGQSFNLALTLLMAYVMFYLVFPEITAKI